GDEVLGKPEDALHAKEMLRKLSGKTHQVYTGITIRNSENTISKTDVAHVEIDELTDGEIDFYIENYQPFDKAGAYGVQEWFGMAKIKRITGSYYTVMGLPTHLVYGILKDFH
ncbi:MAG: Maf family protein, partial [Kaistella sp.]